PAVSRAQTSQGSLSPRLDSIVWVLIVHERPLRAFFRTSEGFRRTETRGLLKGSCTKVVKSASIRGSCDAELFSNIRGAVRGSEFDSGGTLIWGRWHPLSRVGRRRLRVALEAVRIRQMRLCVICGFVVFVLLASASFSSPGVTTNARSAQVHFHRGLLEAVGSA